MERNNLVPGQVEFLDLTHPYLVLVPKDEEGLKLLYDGLIYTEAGEINKKFQYMKMDEKQFLLMEKYLFNFLCVECDLIITMYEEEWADGDKLLNIKNITNKALAISDNVEFKKLANEFLNLVQLSIELKTSLVFYF